MEQAINKIVSESRVFSLFDIGCGSGIISFAAYKLGVNHVIAIDNDPIAVESAKKNLALNNLQGAIEIKVANLDFMTGDADIVVANLDFLTLTEHAEKLARLFREYLIVSGVTKPKWKKLKEKFHEAGLNCDIETVGKEWGAGLFNRNRSRK